jgi:hypothetical protein
MRIYPTKHKKGGDKHHWNSDNSLKMQQNSIILVHSLENDIYSQLWKFDQDTFNSFWDIVHENWAIWPFLQIEKNSFKVYGLCYFSSGS